MQVGDTQTVTVTGIVKKIEIYPDGKIKALIEDKNTNEAAIKILKTKDE